MTHEKECRETADTRKQINRLRTIAKDFAPDHMSLTIDTLANHIEAAWQASKSVKVTDRQRQATLKWIEENGIECPDGIFDTIYNALQSPTPQPTAENNKAALDAAVTRMDYARRGGKVHPEEWQSDIDGLKALTTQSVPLYTDQQWLNLFRTVADGTWTPEQAVEHMKDDVVECVK